MIRDLASDAGSAHQVDTDVFVVGGGTAGLLLATRAAARGQNVTVAELGGRSQVGETHPLNKVIQLGVPYPGADAGRFRCLGGTSTRWGGAMLPFRAADRTPRISGWDIEWPVALADFTVYQSQIEALFGLPDGPYEKPEIMPTRGGVASTFVPRLAKWPKFKLRNVATLLSEQIEANSGPHIWLNATVTRFVFDPAGRVASVEAQSGNGARLLVRARETVIAAGAIESTKLLLLADRQNDDRIFAPDDVLGRYFHDHLSAPTARLIATNRKSLNRVTGFRFEGKGMRNLRFEPSDDLRADHCLPAGFAHISFSTATETGFDLLRSCYRKVQRRDPLSPGDVASLALALPWLSRAMWWRVYEKRLLFPDGADFHLHMVIEQEPRAGNRINLSMAQTDVFGCPMATINWRVGESDVANSLALTRHFASAWKESSLVEFAEIQPLPSETVSATMMAGSGVYHPGGSARMAGSPKSGVVDKDLRTFRVPNFSVVSTAVFPTGGGANPTMMLMMAALRVADRLAATY